MGQVREFLKDRSLHHSAGNWEKAEERIRAAIDEDRLRIEDVVELLRETEEHGSQHVLLYEATREIAAPQFDRAAMDRTLARLELAQLVVQPKVVDMPRSPTIVDVRWSRECFIIKIVEQRTYYEYTGSDERNGKFAKLYDEVPARAVNLFRLHERGLLELRIQSHHNSSQYEEDVNKAWEMADELLPARRAFTPISLAKSKRVLWERREELKPLVRHNGCLLRNNKGNVMAAATGRQNASLSDDVGAAEGLDTFLDHEAHYDRSNIWFLKGNPLPSKDLHILLGGMSNEFALMAKCSQSDYEHALQEIRKYNE